MNSLVLFYKEAPKHQKLEIILTALCTLFLGLGFFGSLADIFSRDVERVLYFLAYLTGGYHGFMTSLKQLKKGKVNVDSLMILAAIGAAIIDNWLEGAVLLFLFSLSETLQSYAMNRSRKEIKSLMKLRPNQALLRMESGEEKVVEVSALEIGNKIVVKPGERIPIDGKILSGKSEIDQSTITGESASVFKTSGDEVYAATLNQNGVLEIEVTKRAEDTTLAKIIKMVEEAQSEKAKLQRFLDKFGPNYALGVIIFTIALILIPYYILGQEFDSVFYRAMTVLVVASPCALIISTPASILSAIAGSAKNGVLFKGGVYLEEASRINAIAFDKTGTLTSGKTEVVYAHLFKNFKEENQEINVLVLAASAEVHSEHHLASAIVKYVKTQNIEIPLAENVKAEIGKGVQAEVEGMNVKVGNRRLFSDGLESLSDDENALLEDYQKKGYTVILVKINDGFAGFFALADQIRPQAKETVSQLKKLGIEHVIMLTGDGPLVAKNVADELGITEVYSELLPEQKVEKMRELTANYKVAMVGDGVNDAPALAISNLGIAMGAVGTDVALETADVVLMADDLSKIPYLLKLAKRAKNVVWQNIGFSLAVIVVLLFSVFLIDLPLPIGVIAHEGSTLIVVLNGLRLLGR